MHCLFKANLLEFNQWITIEPQIIPLFNLCTSIILCCVILHTTQRHTDGIQPCWTEMGFSHPHADGRPLCVLFMHMCTHLSPPHPPPLSLSMCVCGRAGGCYFWERQVWPPRRWQSDQTLCVTYKLLWPFFSSQTHGSMATRDILPNWKECSSPQNTRKWQARKLTAVSVCPLRGRNAPLCSLVFMLCQFPKRLLRGKKNIERLFERCGFLKKIEFALRYRQSAIVETKFCSVS